MPTPELNSLELEFLFSVNFSLHVATDVFEKYVSELANHMGIGVPPGELAINAMLPHVTGLAFTVTCNQSLR